MISDGRSDDLVTLHKTDRLPAERICDDLRLSAGIAVQHQL
jgi:hypothetical protein